MSGIDYGFGNTNLHPNGCRFGVIAINSLDMSVWEGLDPDYGDPCCPKCNHNVEPSPYGKDYFCDRCFDGADPRDGSEERNDHEEFSYWSYECFGDEPIGYSYEDNKYKMHSAFDNTCLFITQSPYYTFARFCSPCAPGAGNLDNTDVGGVKTLCLGHDYFEGGIAPYPVYRIFDDKEVMP